MKDATGLTPRAREVVEYLRARPGAYIGQGKIARDLGSTKRGIGLVCSALLREGGFITPVDQVGEWAWRAL